MSDGNQRRSRRVAPLDLSGVRVRLVRIVPLLRSLLVILEDLSNDLAADVGSSLRKIAPPEEPKLVRVVPRHPTAKNHVTSNAPAPPPAPARAEAARSRKPSALFDLPNPPKTTTRDLGTSSVGEMACLVAIAQHGNDGTTRERIALLTGYSKTTVKEYLPALARRGLTTTRGTNVIATGEGRTTIPRDAKPYARGPKLLRFWLGKLKAGQARCLEEIARVYPEAMSRHEIAEATGYSKTTVKEYLPPLKSRRLIVERHGEGATAASILFETEDDT